MAKAADSKIKAVIERLAKEEIRDVRLYRIDMERDIDSDGESIFRIAVVVDHPEHINSGAMTSFSRLVRNKVLDNDGTYPLISFRSLADDKGMSSEAA
ncbi:hypothetical protein KNJ79_01570 [Sphingopyxis indica]|uniref:hypothetical protein n=1 Tax=Sphingopyxis indica TaxID=436663 RepID=UPI002938D80A|nr:hypothetical protein [Sphingopyxis indica]WOF43683.1 hypothetical protein KNJ79_01570 [Sphingopyxis indica]